MADAHRAHIRVIAGTNGCGKSSIIGAMIRMGGADYFNPDEVAQLALQAAPTLSLEAASSVAWRKGRDSLESAIEASRDFTLETTLGGTSITRILSRAAAEGHRLSLIYIGLDSPDLHIARVAARVALGGHGIPEDKIRQRYDSSRENLLRLMPVLHDLVVFDNSAEADPAGELPPKPVCLLRMKNGRITSMTTNKADVPAWAKPILGAALAIQASSFTGHAPSA